MENRALPVPGERYRHFKNRLYQIVTVASHSETGEQLVIYQALYGDFGVYARPLDMFLSEVDHEKYPAVTQKYRFERVEGRRHEEQEKQEKALEKESGAEACPQGISQASSAQSLLLSFLDAETYAEKLSIVREKRKYIDGRTADDMAASLDLVLQEATLAEKLRDLENCLKTYAKFECSRLR